ncbi:MAG: type II secretion system protein GspD [Magnetovibrionaceae bacterium]
MMRDSWFKSVLLGVFVVLAVSAGQTRAAEPIPWQETLFNRNSSGEPIKDVLTRILDQNGTQAIFRPGVEGAVSFEFLDMPLQGAFQKLITENNLDYDYNADTNTVTVFSRRQAERVQEFVVLESASFDDIVSAYTTHGLGGELTYDRPLRTVRVEGTRAQVATLTQLIKRLDTAAKSRAELRQQTASVNLQIEEVTAKSDLIDKLFNQDVRVIKLRYANVASTSKTFQGETVTVPGIEETLKALLGDEREALKDLPADLRAEIEAVAPDIATGVFVTADPRTNSIVVRGTPDEITNVEEMVRRLDTPVPLVEIEVMIVRGEKGLQEDLGIYWGGELDSTTSKTDKFVGFSSGVSRNGTDAAELNPSAITVGGGLTTTATTSAAGVISTTAQTFLGGIVFPGATQLLMAQVAALEEDNRGQTIGSPVVVTSNNVPATVNRSTTSYQRLSDATSGNTTLEPIDVGLTLTVTPSVIPARGGDEIDLVRMSVSARSTAATLSASTQNPASTSGSEVQTEVVIPTGRTFVLGGLADDTRSDSVQGIPLLRDIPVLGRLFDIESSDDTFTETVFFITPKVHYPEQLRSRDIAERRYMAERRFDKETFQRKLQAAVKDPLGSVPYRSEEE